MNNFLLLGVWQSRRVDPSFDAERMQYMVVWSGLQINVGIMASMAMEMPGFTSKSKSPMSINKSAVNYNLCR